MKDFKVREHKAATMRVEQLGCPGLENIKSNENASVAET